MTAREAAASVRPIPSSLVLWVELDVQPQFRAEFLDALLEDAQGSRRNEPGCLRFDVLAVSDDPDRFLLLEEYRDEEALAAHRAAPHFQRIAAGLPTWLARPAMVLTAERVEGSDSSA